MIKRLAWTSLALALAAPLAGAVNLNPRGTGQVLIYPYYSVDGGNQTLLTVGNPTHRGKAVRMRFSEGRNHRDVLTFNLYLAPFDVWTGALFAFDGNGPANLYTADDSCTVPAIKNGGSLPSLSDGSHYVPFRNFAYAARR